MADTSLSFRGVDLLFRLKCIDKPIVFRLKVHYSLQYWKPIALSGVCYCLCVQISVNENVKQRNKLTLTIQNCR